MVNDAVYSISAEKDGLLLPIPITFILARMVSNCLSMYKQV